MRSIAIDIAVCLVQAVVVTVIIITIANLF